MIYTQYQLTVAFQENASHRNVELVYFAKKACLIACQCEAMDCRQQLGAHLHEEPDKQQTKNK